MEILKKLYVTYPTRGRKCDGCNLGQDYYSDGFRTIPSGLFFHTKCANSSPEISNPYHPQHSLKFKLVAENEDVYGKCNLCTGNLPKMYYNCSICDFSIDLICASKEVIVKIDGGKAHNHPLFLVPKMIRFTCHLCELSDDRFPYACNLCDVSFHKDCAESTSELNYSCHPKHILKRLTCVPNYSNGKCCLCGSKLHIIFYHCSICNFSVDVDCAKNAPSFTLLHPKAHEHSLVFMPQRNFICNVCGINDDPNPYVCPQCNFMIHRNCIDIPHVIKTSRHHHRIHYNHYLDAGDWECEVCHKEIVWTCGAYSCLECPHFAIHLRCATRSKIYDVMELKDTSEDTLEVKSYEVIEEGVIKHFSHNHTLRLKEDNGVNDACMRCIACTYPIISSSYYICMRCDDFILHKKCAYLPRKKIDSIYKMPITLNTESLYAIIFCDICKTHSQGFFYESDNNEDAVLDVRCGSISEPISHESHLLHSLYINYLAGDKVCNACGDKANMFISCEECEFFLDIRCSILPKMVKHKHDEDHFLSLCYEGNPNEMYWCEICEEQVNPKKWFYSCVYCDITFHIKCALGDFMWIKPGNQSDEYFCVLNKNGITRPHCGACGLRCQFSTILKFGKFILCSQQCFQRKFKTMVDEMYGKDTIVA